MGGLFSSLATLIITMRRNMLSSMMTFVMLLTLIVVWSARGNISAFFDRNPTIVQQKDRFDQSIVAGAQINDTLATVRTKVNADRVIIRQFHDSGSDATGLPFMSVTATYHLFAPGVTLEASAFNPVPLSTMNEQMAMMFQPGKPARCATIVPANITNPVYKAYLMRNGVAVAYNCPMLDLRGQPVGFIGVSYLTIEKKRPSEEEIYMVIKVTGERVVGYLDDVIQKEKKPWYQAIFSNKS